MRHLDPIALDWTAFKAVILNKAKLRIFEGNGFYYLYYFDSGGCFETSVISDNTDPNYDGTIYSDFTANYLPYANKNADQPSDTDFTVLTRPKVTALGWTLQDHWFDFSLGQYNSLYSKFASGADTTFVSALFYEGTVDSETLITGANATDQAYLNANCTRTDVFVEPTHDIDVISGEVRYTGAQLTTDVRFWVVVVPDIPALYGGSKELITGGRNLRLMAPNEPYYIEGRTVKHLAYSGTYHTNKFLLRFRHSIGDATMIGMGIDFYKA